MTDLITSENVVAWVAQTTILIAAAALLSRLIGARVARWHLAYLHILLAICPLLPVLQRWG